MPRRPLSNEARAAAWSELWKLLLKPRPEQVGAKKEGSK